MAEKDAVVVDLHEGPSAQSLVGLPDLPEGAPVAASPKAPPAGPPAAKSASAPTRSPKTPAGAGAPPTFASAPSASAKPAWKGKVELGYQQQSGRRDSVSLSARADVERTSGPNSLKGSGRQLYGKQNDKVNSDRRDASVRWRRDFGVRWFAQSLTSYADDKVKLINWNVEQNAGLGYKVLGSKAHVLNLGLGATAQQRDAPGFANDAIMLGEFFEDYTFKVNSRLTLTQDANVLYSPDGRGVVTTSTLATNQANPENYRLRFNSAVQGRVTERVSINLRYEFEFDSSIADPDARRDQRVTSSLGYAF